MNIDLYELVRGPLMTGTLILFLGGLLWRVFQFFKFTYRLPQAAAPLNDHLTTISGGNRRIRSVRRIWRRMRIHYRNTIFGMTPVTAWLTMAYHVIIVLAICFTQGHNVLLDLSWGYSFPSLPENTMDLLNIFMIAVSLYYLLRRTFSAKLKFPHAFRDYLAILATAAPFVTGFIAYHQWFDYTTVITLHLLAGNVLLIVLPFTKIGHMVFFFFVRLYIGSEFGPARGSRDWKT